MGMSLWSSWSCRAYRLAEGGDDHGLVMAQSPEGGRHQVGQGFARACARFHQQVLLPQEGFGQGTLGSQQRAAFQGMGEVRGRRGGRRRLLHRAMPAQHGLARPPMALQGLLENHHPRPSQPLSPAEEQPQQVLGEFRGHVHQPGSNPVPGGGAPERPARCPRWDGCETAPGRAGRGGRTASGCGPPARRCPQRLRVPAPPDGWRARPPPSRCESR